MIDWRKFEFNETPSYSDYVYPVTSSNVNNHVPLFDHHASLLRASPMRNADDRRFAIAQLTKTARETHFASLPHTHVQDTQKAIDILVRYFDRHEKKPLSSYDYQGWPRGYDDDDEDESVGSSQKETCSEDWHDSEALTGLTVDLTAEYFSLELGSNQEQNTYSELGLSISTQGPASLHTSLDAETVGLISLSLPETRHPLDTLPTPYVAPSVTTPQLSSLIATTGSTRNTHPTLSIANLIHPAHISPEPSNHPDDHDVDKMISITNKAYRGTVFSPAVNLAEPPQGSEAPESRLREAREKDAGFSKLNAMRQGFVAIPLRSNRQWKPHRMRRGSRSREDTQKNGSSSRIEPSRTGDQEMELLGEAKDNQQHICDAEHHQSTYKRGPDTDQRHSRGHDGRTQLYGRSSYHVNSTYWSQDLRPDSETSSDASDQDDANDHNGELDEYTAHRLPTSAIKYKPLDHPTAVSQHGAPLRSTLKRKTRDDDEHLIQPPRTSIRPSPNSWTLSGWQP